MLHRNKPVNFTQFAQARAPKDIDSNSAETKRGINLDSRFGGVNSNFRLRTPPTDSEYYQFTTPGDDQSSQLVETLTSTKPNIPTISPDSNPLEFIVQFFYNMIKPPPLARQLPIVKSNKNKTQFPEYPTDIKLYTQNSSESSETTENDTSKYKFVQHPYNSDLILYQFNPGTKCTMFVSDNKIVWTYDPNKNEGKYPENICILKNNWAIIDFREDTEVYIFYNGEWMFSEFFTNEYNNAKTRSNIDSTKTRNSTYSSNGTTDKDLVENFYGMKNIEKEIQTSHPTLKTLITENSQYQGVYGD